MEDSPLTRALFRRELGRGSYRTVDASVETAGLDAIEEAFAGGSASMGPSAADRMPRAVWLGAVSDDPRLAARVEALYPRVAQAGGRGVWRAEELLLELASRRLRPETRAVFTTALSIARPRDSKVGERRAMAVAGLALMAIDGVAGREAVSALAGWAERCRPEDRLDAVEALAEVAARAAAVRKPASAALELAASAEGAPAARLIARRSLAALGRRPPPPDAGVRLDLDVRLNGAPRVLRTVRLSGAHTLVDLHDAIQQAYGWDADHLYQFRLGPDGRDRRAAIAGDEVDEAECLARASEVQLGELGLRRGDRFAYLFDFGDNHLFVIRVVSVEAAGAARRRSAPELVRSVGRAPNQYRW